MKKRLTGGRPRSPRRPVSPEALRAARERARMSAREAAERLSRATGTYVGNRRILFWETGGTRPPEWAVKELARIYRVTQKELWG